MTQSLTRSWTKEITAGYAPPASEETGIRYPCAQRVLKPASYHQERTKKISKPKNEENHDL